MKRKSQILILILGLVIHSQAQQMENELPNNQTFTDYFNSVYHNVDLRETPDNLLYDRVVPFAGLQQFNQRTADTSSYWHFIQAYSELQRAASNQKTTIVATPDFYKHEIGVSYGFCPAILFVPMVWEYLYLNFNIDYKYNFTHKHSLTANLNLFYSLRGNNLFLLTPHIGYRYNYFRRGSITLYLSLALGTQICIMGHDWWFKNPPIFIAYQFCPLGMSIWDDFNIEIGIGNQGLLKIGFDYKFNKK